MRLVHFNPLLRDVDRMLAGGHHEPAWLPRLDVYDRGETLAVRLEMPGIDAEDVEVTVEDRTLTVAGTRPAPEVGEHDVVRRREIRTGEFRRTLVLPEGLDPEAITADLERGILEITIARRPEVLPRKVKVEIGG
jgi:HSP20 family protein